MITENIRRLCNENGISIAALEKATGIGNGIIARWETSSPTVKNLQRVAAYFNVSIDSLLTEPERSDPHDPQEADPQ